MLKQQFIKIGCCNVRMELGNPIKNAEIILEALAQSKAAITVFPELAISGYSCGDLFFQSSLQAEVHQAISHILENNPAKGIVIIGAPLLLNGSLYNTAIVIKGDHVLGVVPKHILPNYKEFSEKRWFKSGLNTTSSSIMINGKSYPFGNIIFSDHKHNIHFGVEICEDMWGAITPGGYLSLSGANLLINLSASNETLYKNNRRFLCVVDNSRRNVCGYIYVSSGIHESTSETVFSGHNIISQCGEVVLDEELFAAQTNIAYGDVDLGKINFQRALSTNLHVRIPDSYICLNQEFTLSETDDFIFEKIPARFPFVPDKDEEKAFLKIQNIQAMGLYKRFFTTDIPIAVIGISGGSDSTLALLATVEAFKRLKRPLSNIHGVFIEGLHSSNESRKLARDLCHGLGITFCDVSLVESMKSDLKLLGMKEDYSNAYQNVQARARTMYLMNYANMINGMVVGTADLSEIALGWSTYNGDHMSMYNPNCGVPKTLVFFLLKEYAKRDSAIKNTLDVIINRVVSPELSPQQDTEAEIGKYEVIDFIIERFLACGDSIERIEYLLRQTFSLKAKETTKYTNLFFKRFFQQQFKRQASPDGPKVLDISLSARSDFKMPSDIKR